MVHGTFALVRYASSSRAPGSGRIWAADAAWRTTEVLKTGALIVSFGEDDDGELYVVDHGGTLFRVSAGAVRRRAAKP